MSNDDKGMVRITVEILTMIAAILAFGFVLFLISKWLGIDNMYTR